MRANRAGIGDSGYIVSPIILTENGRKGCQNSLVIK